MAYRLTMKLASLVIAASLALVSGLAAAETLTLSCKYKSRSDAGIVNSHRPVSRVDQIFIDTDNAIVQLRVANTIGTGHEEVYSHEKMDEKYCLRPLIQINSSGNISGTQQCGGTFSFYYTPKLHEFMVADLYLGGGSIFVWDAGNVAHRLDFAKRFIAEVGQSRLAATHRLISSFPITWPFGPSISVTSWPWRIKARAWTRATSLLCEAGALASSLPRVMLR